jgi:hypothetical protein
MEIVGESVIIATFGPGSMNIVAGMWYGSFMKQYVKIASLTGNSVNVGELVDCHELPEDRQKTLRRLHALDWRAIFTSYKLRALG